MVFDLKQTQSNIPQSSTSSCTEFISEIRCGSNRCPKCCISSAINDHTYEVLKKICKKIIKDLNRKQCRENYSVFDGGNSVKVRIQRGQNVDAETLPTMSKYKVGMADQNYVGPKGHKANTEEYDALGKKRDRAHSKSTKRGGEDGDDDAYGDKTRVGKVGSTKSKKNMGRDEDDYDPSSKKTKDRRSSKQSNDLENENKANKGKSKGKTKPDDDFEDENKANKGKSKGKTKPDDDVDDTERSRKGKGKGKKLDDDSDIDLRKNKPKTKSEKFKDDDDFDETERNKKSKGKGKAKGKNSEALDNDSEDDLKKKKSKQDKSKRKRKSGEFDDDDEHDGIQKRNSKGKKKPKGGGARNEDDEDLEKTGKKPKRKSKSDMPIITDLRAKVRKGQEVRPEGKPKKEKDRLMSLDKELSKLKKKQKSAKQLLAEQQENARGRGKSGRRSTSKQYGSRSAHGFASEARIPSKLSRGDQVRPCDFLRANMEQRELCRLCVNNRAPCSDPCNNRAGARNVCSEVIQSCFCSPNTCF